ncbi:hypothetical protein VTJ49DRAFT_942 [Mycothermus thermophilus]|uniref:Uncharacterized protein n=1 Tax=Humicola insolens TaxID=85995 RepID=A0ABR3VDM7_HUMIN
MAQYPPNVGHDLINYSYFGVYQPIEPPNAPTDRPAAMARILARLKQHSPLMAMKAVTLSAPSRVSQGEKFLRNMGELDQHPLMLEDRERQMHGPSEDPERSFFDRLQVEIPDVKDHFLL